MWNFSGLFSSLFSDLVAEKYIFQLSPPSPKVISFREFHILIGVLEDSKVFVTQVHGPQVVELQISRTEFRSTTLTIVAMFKKKRGLFPVITLYQRDVFSIFKCHGDMLTVKTITKTYDQSGREVGGYSGIEKW